MQTKPRLALLESPARRSRLTGAAGGSHAGERLVGAAETVLLQSDVAAQLRQRGALDEGERRQVAGVGLGDQALSGRRRLVGLAIIVVGIVVVCRAA